ncbi:UNVERIFIED_CONTAM: hypothetical protein FKN15_008776 [Acipenser sinensis]
MPNLALLQKDFSCPYEMMLKKPYAASVFCTRLGSYSSILVAYQSVLLQSLSLDHRLSPLQLDELSLVSNHLIPLSKYNGQPQPQKQIQAPTAPARANAQCGGRHNYGPPAHKQHL